MVWFKVDDGFAFHPKAIAATNAALGLWVRAGAWCGANLTDGELPRHMIGTLGAQLRHAECLVRVGLWTRTNVGYQFVDWADWQPSKEQVRADQEATRVRVANWRDRQRNGVSNGVSNTVGNGVSNGAPTRPDPTRPVLPTEVLSRSTPPRKRGASRPTESTATKRVRDAANALAQIKEERSNGHATEIGPANDH